MTLPLSALKWEPLISMWTGQVFQKRPTLIPAVSLSIFVQPNECPHKDNYSFFMCRRLNLLKVEMKWISICWEYEISSNSPTSPCLPAGEPVCQAASNTIRQCVTLGKLRLRTELS